MDLLNTTQSETRHFPINHRRTTRKSNNHLIRAAAKRYAQNLDNSSSNSNFTATSALREIIPDLDLIPKCQREKKIATALTSELASDRAVSLFVRGANRTRRGRTAGGKQGASRELRLGWPGEEDEGQSLAKSGLALPFHAGFRRRPSLEREEAFRDESTSSRGYHRHQNLARDVRIRRAGSDCEDAQIAELYSMGLLYDNEESGNISNNNINDKLVSSAGVLPSAGVFNLNSILHDEPVYSIRPSKRLRKMTTTAGTINHEQHHLDGTFSPLDLELSFSDIGNDEVIAQIIAATALHNNNTSNNNNEDPDSPASSPRSFAPLRVIYELSASGSTPSIDVDTSQPPDLMLDDYDCFSDSEFEEADGYLRSQREVHAYADREGEDEDTAMEALASPSDTWVVLGEERL